MTGASNIKLLPLPKWLLEGFTDTTIEMLCDYTYACVVHATAPRDIEIEILRAEVKGNQIAVEQLLARAEQLEEALRDIESRHWNGVRPIQIAARVALHKHDQENPS